MKSGTTLFMAMVAVGFIMSAVLQVAALMGHAVASEQVLFALRIAAYVLWLPALFALGGVDRGANIGDLWHDKLGRCPRWMQAALVVVVLYGIANHIYIVVGAPVMNGWRRFDAIAAARLASGHTMIWFAAAFAVLYAAREKSRALTR